VAVDRKNGAVLGWIGGCIAAVVGALWVAFTYFAAPSHPAPPTASNKAPSGGFTVPATPGPPPVTVEAQSGGIAIGGNVSGSTISVGGAPNLGGPNK
jgi:hypothetical protein